MYDGADGVVIGGAIVMLSNGYGVKPTNDMRYVKQIELISRCVP